MAEMAVKMAADLTPQPPYNILWLALNLKTDVSFLLEALPRLMDGILGARQKYNAQNIAKTTWAMATLQEEAPVLQWLLLVQFFGVAGRDGTHQRWQTPA